MRNPATTRDFAPPLLRGEAALECGGSTPLSKTVTDVILSGAKNLYFLAFPGPPLLLIASLSAVVSFVSFW